MFLNITERRGCPCTREKHFDMVGLRGFTLITFVPFFCFNGVQNTVEPKTCSYPNLKFKILKFFIQWRKFAMKYFAMALLFYIFCKKNVFHFIPKQYGGSKCFGHLLPPGLYRVVNMKLFIPIWLKYARFGEPCPDRH
jgi:hypothetical protein